LSRCGSPTYDIRPLRGFVAVAGRPSKMGESFASSAVGQWTVDNSLINTLTMFCSRCGSTLESDAKFCGVCGGQVATVKDTHIAAATPGHKAQVSKGSTSLSLNNDSTPWEIRGWNWGAFGLTWIWGLGNDTYISLLALVPIVNIVMAFVLGARGNEWAWRNSHWESIEHFKAVQKRWTSAWLILLGIGILITIIALIVFSAASSSNQ
jgi:hypothetical protein